MLTMENLTVGYNGKAVISDINVNIEQGSIVTLIGPNGAGKSTILKSIAKQLEPICGAVYLEGKEIARMSAKDMAKGLSVVFTDRIRTELMTCREVAALGRYPHTGYFGRLDDKDIAIVEEALQRVGAQDIAHRDFDRISDGQKQKVLIARAICQQTPVIVLDEPTSYLDIKHKIEILEVLKNMAKEHNTTIIMSLHEIDLASKVSDIVMCVKDNRIDCCGAAEDIFTSPYISRLYDIDRGFYNALTGSTELEKMQGECKTFVIAGGGFGIPVYRKLQKDNIPFATGILYENDVDYQVAQALAGEVVTAPSFTKVTDETIKRAVELIEKADVVIDAKTPVGDYNTEKNILIEAAGGKLREWK